MSLDNASLWKQQWIDKLAEPSRKKENHNNKKHSLRRDKKKTLSFFMSHSMPIQSIVPALPLPILMKLSASSKDIIRN